MAKREHKDPLTLPKGTAHIALVQSLFNSDITHKQLVEAQRCAQEYGVSFDVFTAAGAFELPQVIDTLIVPRHYDAAVAIGCLIKGDTAHFEMIASAVSHGLMEVSLRHHLPIGFGVITACTREQAELRTWIGYDATYAVLHTLSQRYAHQNI